MTEIKRFNKLCVFAASYKNDRLYRFKDTSKDINGKVGFSGYMFEANRDYEFKYNDNFTFEVREV